MSNLIFPLCGIAIRLATASPPKCVCVYVILRVVFGHSMLHVLLTHTHTHTDAHTAYLANMFHPNRQVKAGGADRLLALLKSLNSR